VDASTAVSADDEKPGFDASGFAASVLCSPDVMNDLEMLPDEQKRLLTIAQEACAIAQVALGGIGFVHLVAELKLQDTGMIADEPLASRRSPLPSDSDASQKILRDIVLFSPSFKLRHQDWIQSRPVDRMSVFFSV
jgi:hypothetical protein